MLGEEEAVSAGSMAQVGGWHGDIPGELRSASLCQVVSLCCLIWLFSACRGACVCQPGLGGRGWSLSMLGWGTVALLAGVPKE